MRRSRRAFGQRPGGVKRTGFVVGRCCSFSRFCSELLVRSLLSGSKRPPAVLQRKCLSKRRRSRSRSIIPGALGYQPAEVAKRDRDSARRSPCGEGVAGRQCVWSNGSRVPRPLSRRGSKRFGQHPRAFPLRVPARRPRSAWQTPTRASTPTFKHQKFRDTTSEALRSLRTRIASLPHTPLRTTLERQAKQLSQIQKLELGSTTVLQQASATTPVRIHAPQHGIIGGLLGLLLAIALLLGLLRIFPDLRPPRSPSIRTLLAGGVSDCNCRTCQEQRQAPLEAS